MQIDNIGEELRVLYVALTRAKEKLIITGCVKSLVNEIESTTKQIPTIAEAGALLPYSKRPAMLSFDDINGDKDYWINRIMARYYEKDSVVLGDR